MWNWMNKKNINQEVVTNQPKMTQQKADLKVDPQTYVNMKNACNCNDCFSMIFNCQKDSQNYQGTRVTNQLTVGLKNNKSLIKLGIVDNIEADPRSHIDLSNACNCSNCFSCVFNCQKDSQNPNDVPEQREALLPQNNLEEQSSNSF